VYNNNKDTSQTIADKLPMLSPL